MAPFPESTIDVGYPLYGCDFDPQDSNRLFVGGGGGATKSGVGNKITLLDASSLDKLEPAGEVTLSGNEDNVANLVAGQRKGKATLLYAGINSSPDDLKKEKNEHFRVFSVEPPKAKAVLGARITELSRTQLFTTADSDTYQRLLKLSQPFAGCTQLGAVATGFANTTHQIALYDVATGTNVAPKPRGVLETSKEAVDMDVIQTAEDQFQVLYCDDYDIYSVNVPKTGEIKTEPTRIYTIPHDDSSGLRPALRCLRYLSPSFAVGVGNLPQAGGVVIYGFRLPKPGKEDTRARISVNAKLPKRQGFKATGLAVANLSPVSAPGAPQGDAQFVLAVTGTDLGIHLYTLDHQIIGDIDMLANLLPLTTLRAVHAAMITSLSFSHFAPPKSGTGRIQHLRLASTSVANAVTVHSLPLRKFIDPSAPVRRGGPPRQPRYILAMSSRRPTIWGLVAGITCFVLVLAILLQGILEVKGLAPPTVGGHRWLPSAIHAVPPRPVPQHSGFLAKLLAEKAGGSGDEHVVVLDVDGKEVEVTTTTTAAAAEGEPTTTTWENLKPEQKEAWKDRLRKSGHWAEEYGETIFKGILFGELAGVVGGFVAG
ncbi:hypothetical protein J7T55_007428 [Diaporthe amygdali]|uniref:uncharacterized protein n=1 Tax=Phomopsis amygdali TaxID=1214568 RepID=UPI0022FDB711|nr:uncharacterized protein J7T55_007428 [Diaporthe amygdali]KAJ0116448.1 hypothetical protein J7T55_007428 [Diaporthe amygdali]